MKTLTPFFALLALLSSINLSAQGLCGNTTVSYYDKYIFDSGTLYIAEGDSVKISSVINDSYVCNFSLSSVKVYKDSILYKEVENSTGADEIIFWLKLTPGYYQVESSVPTHRVPTFNLLYTGTGIQEAYVDKLSFYPNPVVNVLMIEGPREYISVLELIDLSGRKIYTTEVIPHQLDLSDLSAGSYVLRMIGKDGKSLSKQIMKAAQ